MRNHTWWKQLNASEDNTTGIRLDTRLYSHLGALLFCLLRATAGVAISSTSSHSNQIGSFIHAPSTATR